MNIKLHNGIELTPIVVLGESRFAQGSQRDTLKFVFPASIGMDYIDSVFSSDACESVSIVDDNGNEYTHTGYTLRVSLGKEAVKVSVATAESDAVYEDRIFVVMGERTYSENQFAKISKTVSELEQAMNVLLGGDV